ncbi:choice-of-anchor D domain-containing protein [Desulfococcaceae bacterium HSG9]|nr:choice-of-anchor D domain-containing protein [Desulfococcaceae bacterium HSG9]
MNGWVYALAFDSDGNLYAGGRFTNAGGVADADYIAKLDGSDWSAVGKGMDNSVTALAFDSAGNLYANGAGGGSTSIITKWDGSAWSAVGNSGTFPMVYVLAFDSDSNPYMGGTLPLDGYIVKLTAPEMNLKLGATNITDGGTHNFGGKTVNTDANAVFTIENTGDADLTMATPLTLGGTDADQFSIQTQPTSPVAVGDTTTFTVRFSPTSVGAKSATVSIDNNDNDENPYNLIVTGKSTPVPAPEMNLKLDAANITDGGTHDFGGKTVNTDANTVFTIENTGDADLTVATSLTLGGTDADQFSIQTQPTSPVTAGDTTTFTVRFSPTSVGAKSATVSIDNNDNDENPYNLNIQGTGTVLNIQETGTVTGSPAPVATVMYVTSTAADGTLSIGTAVTLTVHFSYLVWVKGMPSLALNTGGPVPEYAYYNGGSGTKIITFEYTVASGDDITELDYWSQWALELNGGQIQDNLGDDVILDLPAPGTAGSLSGDIALSLDPEVMYVTSTASDGTLSIGTAVTFTVHFSDSVSVKGTPLLALNTGGPVPVYAYYNGGSGTDTLTFQYTIAAGDMVTNLEYWSSSALELNGGQIQNNLGDDVILTLPAPGTPGSLSGGVITAGLDTDYPVFRLYCHVTKKHHFTMDENEKNTLIALTDADGAAVWRDEGIAWHAFRQNQYKAASRQQKTTLQAVHRFYSETLQTHLFTVDENEKEHLIANAADVWRYEDVAFYVPADYQDGMLPVYRFYSEALKVHLFTVDENEKNTLVETAGDVWRFEGVAYYVYP